MTLIIGITAGPESWLPRNKAPATSGRAAGRLGAAIPAPTPRTPATSGQPSPPPPRTPAPTPATSEQAANGAEAPTRATSEQAANGSEAPTPATSEQAANGSEAPTRLHRNQRRTDRRPRPRCPQNKVRLKPRLPRNKVPATSEQGGGGSPWSQLPLLRLL